MTEGAPQRGTPSGRAGLSVHRRDEAQVQHEDADDPEQAQAGADDAGDEAPLGLRSVVRQALGDLLLTQDAEHDRGTAEHDAGAAAAERDRDDTEDQRDESKGVLRLTAGR